MDHRRLAWLPGEPRGQIIGKSIEMVPKLLFWDVLLGAALESNDARPIPDRLLDDAVIRTHGGIQNPPRDQIDLTNAWVPCKRPGKIHYIFGLPTRVRVAAQLQIMAANKAMNTQQTNIETINFCVFGTDIFLPAN